MANQKPKYIPSTGGYSIPRGTTPVGSKPSPTPPPRTSPTPPKGGGEKRSTAKVIKHFSETHTKHGQGYGNARALRKLYRGGAPTGKEQRQFAKEHPLFVKNNPQIAKRLLGVGKKPKVKGKPSGP